MTFKRHGNASEITRHPPNAALNGDSHVRRSFRSTRWLDLVRRTVRTLERRQGPRADPWSPLRLERIRGRARLWGRDFQVDAAFGAAEEIGRDSRFRDPLHGRGDRCGEARGSAEEWLHGRLYSPCRMARLGDDGRFGAAQ